MWVLDEEAPCVLACVEDGAVAVPDEVAELVASQISPDVFHRVQFRRIGWQPEQGDVVGHAEPAAWLMPSGAVADQNGVGARRDHGGDLDEMLIHRLGIDRRHDDRRAHRALGADCPKQIDGIVPIVAHHGHTRADQSPSIGVGSLLSNTGFILEPNLDQLVTRGFRQKLRNQGAEVFLKVAWATRSFFG